MSSWSTMFLGVLGGAVLCLGFLLLATKFFWRRFLKGLAQGAGAPVRLTTQALKEPAIWKKARLVRGSRRFLEAQGFRWTSDIQIAEVEGLLCCCLVNDQGAAAILYDHSKLGFWVDLCLPHGERGGLTVSSQTQGKNLRVPPFAQKYLMPAAGVEELWDLFCEKSKSIDSSSVRVITSQSLQEDFETAYADEMDWRSAQGGPTRQEVRLTLEEAGATPSEEEVEEAWLLQVRLAGVALDEGLQQRFAQSLTEQDRLRFRTEDVVAIHDRLEEMHLLEHLLYFVADEEYEPTGLPAECLEKPARQAFESLQGLLPKEVRFERVGQLTFPLEVDFYLPPRGSIPVEVFPHKKIDEDC